MLWENLREEEFYPALEKCGGLCVISMGSIEKHGEHLPLGTNSIIAEEIAKSATELEDAIYLNPGRWFGEASHFHADTREDNEKFNRWGNFALKQSTLMEILETLLDEIGRNRFDRILIVNHNSGNNNFLRLFLRAIAYTDKPYATLSAEAVDSDLVSPAQLLKLAKESPDEFNMLTPEDIETLKVWCDKSAVGPGGFIETCLIMADHPEFVQTDKYDDVDSSRKTRLDHTSQEGLFIANSWYATNPDGYMAEPPYGASQTIGQAMKKILTQRMADIFRRIKAREDIMDIVWCGRKPTGKEN